MAHRVTNRTTEESCHGRDFPTHSLPYEPPPLGCGTGKRHGVSSRDGGAGGTEQLRQPSAHARTVAGGVGMDVARPAGAKTALCREEAVALAGIHGDRCPHSSIRHWSDHGDFLHSGRRDAEAASVYRSAKASGGWGHNG